MTSFSTPFEPCLPGHFFVLFLQFFLFAYFALFKPSSSVSRPTTHHFLSGNLRVRVCRARFRRARHASFVLQSSDFSFSFQAFLRAFLLSCICFLPFSPSDSLIFLRVAAFLAISLLPSAFFFLLFLVFGGWFFVLAFNLLSSSVLSGAAALLVSLHLLSSTAVSLLSSSFQFTLVFVSRLSTPSVPPPPCLNHRQRRLFQCRTFRRNAKLYIKTLRHFAHLLKQTGHVTHARILTEYLTLRSSSCHLRRSWRILSTMFPAHHALSLLTSHLHLLRVLDPWLYHLVQDAHNRSNPRRCRRARVLLRSFFQPLFYTALLHTSSTSSFTTCFPRHIAGGGQDDSAPPSLPLENKIVSSQQLHSFVTRLASMHLTLGDAPSDGNCLFHSLSTLLLHNSPPSQSVPVDHLQLRAQLCDFLQSSSSQSPDLATRLQQYVMSHYHQSLQQYFDRMRQPGVQGDSPVCWAFARVYDLRLVVHDPTTDDPAIFEPLAASASTRTCHLAWTPGGAVSPTPDSPLLLNHFQPLHHSLPDIPSLLASHQPSHTPSVDQIASSPAPSPSQPALPPTLPDDLASLNFPSGTRDWHGAIAGLMACSFSLDSVFSHSPFTASVLSSAARYQFLHCALPLLQVIQQTDMDSDLHMRLVGLFWALPHLLLRVGPKDSVDVVTSKIVRNANAFQRGQWASLIAQAGPRPRRSSPTSPAPDMDIEEKVLMAQRCIQAGSLKKARTLLTSNGMASGDTQEIIDDLHRRHPTSKTPSAPPFCATADPDQSFSFTTEDFLSVLRASPPQKARDQWGWRLREHFLPLLSDATCGNLLVALILVPIANGHFAFPEPARTAGGKLFALSKAPKKGVRPIVVTDAVRALVGKVLYSRDGYRQQLNNYFTDTHPRVMQMGVGLHNGATIMQHLIWALLDAPAASSAIEHRQAAVSVDARNAFNELSRSFICDTINNNRGAYGTDLFTDVAPFLASFYGSKGQLRYTANNGSVINISSEEGTHQGDVWSPALFAATIHPTLCHVMDSFPDVIALLWADNIYFVGPLLQAAQAARQLRDDFKPLGLAFNDNETLAYVPYSPGVSLSQLSQVLSTIPDFTIRPVTDGIKILGVPFGTDAYTSAELANIVSKIQADVPQMAALRDGLMHFQMLRFCENTRFSHAARALPPQKVRRAAQQVDKVIMNAFEQYWGWPEMPDAHHARRYAAARLVVRGPLREGGFGLTSVLDVSLPAFYHAAAHSLRWICNRPSLANILRWDLNLPPRHFNNSFVGEFLDAEESLLCHGCSRPEDSSLRPTGATALLPRWKDLIFSRADGSFFPLPPQRVIVRSYLTLKHPTTSTDNANQYPFMCNRKLQTVRDHTVSPLKDKLGFTREQLRTASISYNPMAFLMAIPVTRWQLFPKGLFQHWVRLALDLPFDDCQSVCKHCGQPQDDSGHHHATCPKAASRAWKRGHDHVVDALSSMLQTADLPHTSKEAQIPTHADSGKKGDILVQCKIGHFEDLVLDFSLTHPRTGSSKILPIGAWKPDALAHAARLKDRKHAIAYENTNHAFLSLTADTYGKISEDFVRFLWMMANSAAVANSRLSQPPSDASSSVSTPVQLDTFAALRGSFFSRMRVQLGAAIAKAAAVRFITDNTDDGLPLHTCWDRRAHDCAAPLPDLPLYHAPC